MKKPLLIFLALICALEGLTAFWLPALTLRSDMPLMRAKKDLAGQKLDAQILIFGDSSAGLGIDAKLLGQETGFKTANLALLAPCNSAAHLLLLKNYLRHNPKPKAILLMHAFDIWWRDLEMETPWPPGSARTAQTDVLAQLFGLDFWNVALAYRQRNPQGHMPFARFFHNFLPSQKYALDLRQLVEGRRDFWSRIGERLRQGTDHKQRLFDTLGDYRHYLFASPAEELEAQDADSVRLDARLDWDWMKSHEFTVSPFNQDSLDQLLRFTSSEGIEIWIALPPLWEEFQTHPEAQAVLEKHRLFLRSLGEKYARVHFLNEDYYWAKMQELLNSVEHLTTAGQASLTHQLAQKIKTLN
ncbi:MAG: hypothetical protein A2Y02_01355 [Omnitrophica bacterium GWA2_52_12]|nr:MAG: hypothetical protein A2Y02_01355 [Omnitrophica bacterium GWA2_52_12]